MWYTYTLYMVIPTIDGKCLRGSSWFIVFGRIRSASDQGGHWGWALLLSAWVPSNPSRAHLGVVKWCELRFASHLALSLSVAREYLHAVAPKGPFISNPPCKLACPSMSCVFIGNMFHQFHLPLSGAQNCATNSYKLTGTLPTSSNIRKVQTLPWRPKQPKQPFLTPRSGSDSDSGLRIGGETGETTRWHCLKMN
jgi:hypothetical protein